ncbi:hypothetical protein PG997_014277 [Apiospora hydei]|uniref:NAD dependent epimerase/dehydratase n=1 Tax=Apiospora hydei TaxID=1337664 RepID=A0ABR1UVV8_9PEZI
MGGVPSKPDYSKSLQVIGAGFPRTGTSSMQLALERLLDGPVAHGGSHMVSNGRDFGRKWGEACLTRRAGDRERTLKLVREGICGFVGCTDVPCLWFLEELLELHPGVKVVLVTREPEKWHPSLKGVFGHIEGWWLPLVVCIHPGLRWMPVMVSEFARQIWLLMGDSYDHHTFGPEFLPAYQDWVKSVVPKEQLLVMSLKEGWDPLCKFLDKPVPEEPFPKVNDAAAADATAAKAFGMLGLMWMGIFSTLGAGVYASLNLWRR